MRVISQDGAADYPYECTGFYCGAEGTRFGGYVYADFGGDEALTMARYETRGKAVEAMAEMLRAYSAGAKAYMFRRDGE